MALQRAGPAPRRPPPRWLPPRLPSRPCAVPAWGCEKREWTPAGPSLMAKLQTTLPSVTPRLEGSCAPWKCLSFIAETCVWETEIRGERKGPCAPVKRLEVARRSGRARPGGGADGTLLLPAFRHPQATCMFSHQELQPGHTVCRVGSCITA